jgi:hypothetical protein
MCPTIANATMAAHFATVGHLGEQNPGEDLGNPADLEKRPTVVGRIADRDDAARAVSLEHANDDADLPGDRPCLSRDLPDGFVRGEVPFAPPPASRPRG